MTNRFFGFLVGLCLLSTVHFGGAGGCGGGSANNNGGGGGGGGGGTPTTRALTGSIAANSLGALRIQGKSQALSCSNVTVCCSSYSGGLVTKAVDAACSFSLDLPLNNICYCGLFTGNDEDNNGCPDTEVGSLGCSENGYSGAIPIYPDADDSTDPINLGEGTLQGRRLVVTAAGNPCAQVDQDNDGTDDSSDNDDDGDDVNDSDDNTNNLGCENLDEYDSNNNGTPDLFEAFYAAEFAALKLQTDGDSAAADFFRDTDNDDVPDGCDEDFGCAADSFDSNGDCIPDEFDYCSTEADEDGNGNADSDNDNDGVSVCEDCDDGDDSVTTECYSDCGDIDQDGVDDCVDCDASNPDVTFECYECNDDADGDGVPSCVDCDDNDPNIGEDCGGGSTACTDDQECKDAVQSSDDPGTTSDDALISSAVDHTTCNTSSGACEVNCAGTGDQAGCETHATDAGSTCDGGVCSFMF